MQQVLKKKFGAGRKEYELIFLLSLSKQCLVIWSLTSMGMALFDVGYFDSTINIIATW